MGKKEARRMGPSVREGITKRGGRDGGVSF